MRYPSGLRRTWYLQEFDDLSYDITAALKFAVGYAQATGGGRIIIPAGEWYLSGEILLSAPWPGAILNPPIWIEGEGEWLTRVYGKPGVGQAMFRFDTSRVPGGTYNYGGIRKLALQADGPGDVQGDGVIFSYTLFTAAEHIWVNGFNRGVVSYGCQDQNFRDVHCQDNYTGWLMQGYNQVSLNGCQANQNRTVGMYVGDGAGMSWTDGLMQGSATIAGLLVAPTTASAVRLHMRNMHFENGAGTPVRALPPPGAVQYAGTIRLEDVNFNGGGSGLMSEWYGYHLHLSNFWTGYPSVLGRFHGCQIFADNLPEGVPGKWLADQNTLDWSHWRGFPGVPGKLELEAGTPPYQPVLSPADTAYIAATRAYIASLAALHGP